MYPPAWLLETSERLDFDEFQQRFAAAWARLESRFLKLETWQSYLEAEGNTSQEAFNRGDLERARELLRAEAEGESEVYAGIRGRGLEFTRVRLVQEPISDYLRYELMAYGIRSALGENIEVVRCDPELSLPNENCFDCLLFDRHTALIHDYGDGEVGHQTGGWITHDSRAIETLSETFIELRSRSIPLAEFLSGMPDRMMGR